MWNYSCLDQSPFTIRLEPVTLVQTITTSGKPAPRRIIFRSNSPTPLFWHGHAVCHELFTAVFLCRCPVRTDRCAQMFWRTGIVHCLCLVFMSVATIYGSASCYTTLHKCTRPWFIILYPIYSVIDHTWQTIHRCVSNSPLASLELWKQIIRKGQMRLRLKAGVGMSALADKWLVLPHRFHKTYNPLLVNLSSVLEDIRTKNRTHRNRIDIFSRIFTKWQCMRFLTM